MTAIVRLALNNYPVLIGDLLLSAPEFPGHKFSIPTVQDISTVFPEGSGFMPSGLRQKITIIENDLVIGWAGNTLAASSVIKELIAKNLHQRMTGELLKSYFESLDESVWTKPLGFAGFVKEQNRLEAFGVNCESFLTDSFGEVALLGTGGDSVRKYLTQLSVLPLPVDRTGNLLTQSVLTALGLSGSLLSSEITSHSTLYEFFGAGYEIATIVEGAFRKADDITYLFWKAQTDGQRVRLPFPHRSLKFSYVRDILVVRVDSMTPLSGGLGFSTETSCHFVSPIYRHIDRQELDGFVPPSMNSKFMCNYFTFRDQNGMDSVLTSAACVGKEEPSIRFIEDGWKTKQFAIKDAYVEEIADRIREQFKA